MPKVQTVLTGGVVEPPDFRQGVSGLKVFPHHFFLRGLRGPVEGSADSRFASTQPADPAPTMM